MTNQGDGPETSKGVKRVVVEHNDARQSSSSSNTTSSDDAVAQLRRERDSLQRRVSALEKDRNTRTSNEKRSHNVGYSRKKEDRFQNPWKAENKKPEDYSTPAIDWFYIYIYIVLILDLFVFEYSTVTGLGARFTLYLIIPFVLFFLFVNDGPLYALTRYGSITLFHLMVGPLLFYVLQYMPLPAAIEANINLAIVLFPPWLIYLQFRGIYWHHYIGGKVG